MKLTTCDTAVLPSLRNAAYSVNPWSKRKASRLPTRSSSNTISTPALRNASSRRRLSSVSWLKLVPPLTSVNSVGSGLKLTLVPDRLLVPTTFRSWALTPRSNRMAWTRPSRLTSMSIHSLTKLVTDAPTPCRPPLVL